MFEKTLNRSIISKNKKNSCCKMFKSKNVEIKHDFIYAVTNSIGDLNLNFLLYYVKRRIDKIFKIYLDYLDFPLYFR